MRVVTAWHWCKPRQSPPTESGGGLVLCLHVADVRRDSPKRQRAKAHHPPTSFTPAPSKLGFKLHHSKPKPYYPADVASSTRRNMSGIAQVQFDGFSIIDFGRTATYELYQSLYKDRTEPVGCMSIAQAFGQLQPSDQAIQTFQTKWKIGAGRRVMGTLEFVTGKSSTTKEMARTPHGEVAVLVMSFLIEALGADTASDLGRQVISTTPDHLISIRPAKAQITGVILAIESQTGNVSWHDEIQEAQACVIEGPVLWDTALSSHQTSRDIPIGAMGKFYQALCAVSRFPADRRCILRTTFSLSLPFVLAHSICGVKVCVIVDGAVVYGHSALEQWQVKLERLPGGTDNTETVVELLRTQTLEDPEVLFQTNEVGPKRFNRIAVDGIAKAATIGQGLGDKESGNVAVLSVWAAGSILQKWQREVADEWNSTSNDASSSESDDPEALDSTNDPHTPPRFVPVKSRLSVECVCTWWGCQPPRAREMLNAAAKISPQFSEHSWAKLPFCREIMGRISSFEDLDYNQQAEARSRDYHALNRKDFGRLTHILTVQLLLIMMLKSNDMNPLLDRNAVSGQVRVRSSCHPEQTALGSAIKNFNNLKPLRQSDVLHSWRYWLHGESSGTPESGYGLGGPDALAAGGYLVYRSLLLDLNLDPSACEVVTVEPGHISLDNQRFTEICGPDEITLVEGQSHYHARLQTGAKLKSHNHTGVISLNWNVTAADSTSKLDLELVLTGGDSRSSQLKIKTSVYQLAKLSWGLQYGDRSLSCRHNEDRVGEVFEGEQILITSAGNLRSPDPGWNPLQLFSAKGSSLGRIACLLSAPPDSQGMVRMDACLRCCVTACSQGGLDFLID